MRLEIVNIPLAWPVIEPWIWGSWLIFGILDVVIIRVVRRMVGWRTPLKNFWPSHLLTLFLGPIFPVLLLAAYIRMRCRHRSVMGRHGDR